jgi:hypothetical protein
MDLVGSSRWYPGCWISSIMIPENYVDVDIRPRY